MAKPLRIGSLIDVDRSLSDTVAELRRFADAGLDHAFAVQIFGPDALTLLAAAGAQVPGIGLGTGVVPVYPRHPMMLAQQALTVQLATANRLILGIGLSHQVVVEGMWGMSFEKPARYMKEYLAALMPLLHGEKVSVAGERLTTNTFAPLEMRDVTAPPVLVAALGDTMLKLAGRVADGTVTWMTGISTIESHIAPVIRAAAEKAGRPAPRIGVSLPISVTADIEATRERMNEEFAIYPNLPSYKAMLDKEGASCPADVAIVGDEDVVRASIDKLAAAGATDFVASVRRYPRGAGPHLRAAQRDRPFGLIAGRPEGSALQRRVLELVEVRLLVHEPHDPLDGAPGQRGIALGPAHQPDEHRPAVDDEGRHAEDAPLVDRLQVGPLDLLDRTARFHLGQDLVTGDAGGVEDAGHHRGLPEVERLVVTGREEGVMHRPELLGVLVAHHHTGGQGDQIGQLGRVVPDRRAAFGHVDLAEREGKEGDVPVRSVGQSRHQVLMGVAGEGTPVVPGHGEWLHSRFNT